MRMMIGRSDSLLVTYSVFTHGARKSSAKANRPMRAPIGMAIAIAIANPTKSCWSVGPSTVT